MKRPGPLRLENCPVLTKCGSLANKGILGEDRYD
jgi:hypothetical protein